MSVVLVTYRELGERCKLESRLSGTTKAGRGYGPFLRRHISQARWRFLNLCALREATAWSRESTSADDILVLSRENGETCDSDETKRRFAVRIDGGEIDKGGDRLL